MLQKIIDCKSFKNSQENGVYFTNVASLRCRDCTSTINRLHHKFFSENVLKTGCLKRTFLKKFLVYQRCKIFPWWKNLFSKNAGLELLKTDSTTGITWHGFQVPLFNISESFLRGISVIPLIQEVVTLLNDLFRIYSIQK